MMAKSLMRLGCGDAAALKLLRLMSCCAGTAIHVYDAQPTSETETLQLSGCCASWAARHNVLEALPSIPTQFPLQADIAEAAWTLAPVRSSTHAAMALTALAHRSDTSRRKVTKHAVSIQAKPMSSMSCIDELARKPSARSRKSMPPTCSCAS